MLNEIVKGVSMQLTAVFSDVRVYQDDVRQGLKAPCFFIGTLKAERQPLGGGRYLSRNPLDVQFIPKNSVENGEMCAAAEKLFSALEFITLPDGSLAHGSNMSCEIVDGVLHFFVSYSLTLRREQAQTPMEELAVDAGIRENVR